MKTINKINSWTLIITLMILSSSSMGQKSVFDEEIYYYGIEIGGVMCGYSESSKKLVKEDGKEWLQVVDEVIMKLTVLGQDVDISIANYYRINPKTNRYFYCERRYSGERHPAVSGCFFNRFTK